MFSNLLRRAQHLQEPGSCITLSLPAAATWVMAGTAIYHPITKEHKQQQMNDLTIQNSSETESDKTLGPHFCPDLQCSTFSKGVLVHQHGEGVCFKVVQKSKSTIKRINSNFLGGGKGGPAASFTQMLTTFSRGTALWTAPLFLILLKMGIISSTPQTVAFFPKYKYLHGAEDAEY